MARAKTTRARPGDHGPVSAEQAVAIDAKARRAGIPIPEKHTGVDTTKKKARRDRVAASRRRKPDPRRAKATKKALKRRAPRTKRR
ncbi:MAG: hypothetical protein H0T42_21990 [Deltaproteobacteria bacterium]|nr:hypothetical protein [Deltaproteobacteria bacterium]